MSTITDKLREAATKLIGNRSQWGADGAYRSGVSSMCSAAIGIITPASQDDITPMSQSGITPTSEPVITPRDQVAAISSRLLDAFRPEARRLGWALAVHGSMTRDLDLIAVPWEEDAAPEETLVERLRNILIYELGGDAFVGAGGGTLVAGATRKPHGRRSWTLHSTSEMLVEDATGAHPYVDLAIMDVRAITPTSDPITPPTDREAHLLAFVLRCAADDPAAIPAQRAAMELLDKLAIPNRDGFFYATEEDDLADARQRLGVKPPVTRDERVEWKHLLGCMLAAVDEQGGDMVVALNKAATAALALRDTPPGDHWAIEQVKRIIMGAIVEYGDTGGMAVAARRAADKMLTLLRPLDPHKPYGGPEPINWRRLVSNYMTHLYVSEKRDVVRAMGLTTQLGLTSLEADKQFLRDVRAAGREHELSALVDEKVWAREE